MSMYANLTDDLSNRCNNIFDKYYECLKKDGFEVTFLLMLATTGFTIPHEKLDKLQKNNDNRNIKKFKKEVFDRLATKNIVFAKVIKKDTYDHFEDYQNNSEENTINQMGEFLQIIRNALAHGNIFFTGDETGNIKEVAFVSENRKKSGKCSECNNTQAILDKTHPYKYIHFKDMDDFKLFLELWFNFIKS